MSKHSISRRSLLMAASAGILAAKPSLRVGSQTNAWRVDPKNIESLISVLMTIKQLGFEGFETSFLNLRDQFDNPDEAYDRLKKTGLKFFGIHIFLTRYDPQTAIAPWDLLQEVADGGHKLNAERLIVSGAPTVHPLALRAKADALSRIAKYCRGIGIGFAYHNHQPEFQEGGVQINGLLSETDPSVHFLLDAGHAIEGGGNVADFFSKNWRRIDGIHLRDMRGGKEVPLGQGEYDYRPLAQAIEASNWKGWLLTEEERLSGEKLGETAVKPARETIRKVFGV